MTYEVAVQQRVDMRRRATQTGRMAVDWVSVTFCSGMLLFVARAVGSLVRSHDGGRTFP